MTTQITTLEQAYYHLVQEGVVNFEDMTVEGKQLLEVCGYRTDSDVKKSLERQIEKHNFAEGIDFTKGKDTLSESRKKPMVYKLTMNAASIVYSNAVNRAITCFHERKETNFGRLLKSAFPEEDLVTQFPINSKRIDFYLPLYNLAIEYDELYHLNQKEEDLARQTMIERELDCSFIRVPEGGEGKAIIEIYNFIINQKNL